MATKAVEKKEDDRIEKLVDKRHKELVKDGALDKEDKVESFHVEGPVIRVVTTNSSFSIDESVEE